MITIKFIPILLSRCALLLCLISLLACNDSREPKDDVSGTFVWRSAEETGVNFNNTITETENVNIVSYDYLYNGAGVGVGDFNQDGLVDVFFASNQGQDEFYWNKGNLKFELDNTIFSGNTLGIGWSTGVCVTDINNDGWLDIYVCKSGPGSINKNHKNQLWINEQGTFSEQAAAYGLDYAGHTTQALFFDADHDGDQDCYLLTHPGEFNSKLSVAELATLYNEQALESDQFFLNEDGDFKNSNSTSGIDDFAFGLGVVAEDFDGDGWLDIYVSNDFDEGDMLYINQKDGSFKNEIDKRMKHISNFGMGCDAADFNNDALPDLITADMAFEDHERSKRNMETMNPEKFEVRTQLGWHYQYMSNCLQLNRNNQVFSEIAQLSGVAKSDWSWSPLFADVDNDGFKDLMITNGYKRDTKDQDLRARIDSLKEQSNSVSLDVLLDQFNSTKVSNKIYRNNTDLTFKDSNSDWNFNQEVHSHGAVLVDLDNDGDLDIITNNVDEKASIIENQLSNKNWLQIDGSSISEPGTELLLYSKLGIQRQLVQATRGYASSVIAPVHFGLNQLESIDSLLINYIDGRQEVVKDLSLNNKNSINKGETRLKPRKTIEEPLFEVHSPKSVLAFAHRENTYNDFDKEVLLPHKMSREGPALAAGDVNGDGLVDAWIGSSAGLTAALFAQGKDGKFIGFIPPSFAQDAQYEDGGAVFFDADQDGDLDLYVSSGSNEFEDPLMYQDRLYINSGNGELIKSFNRLPVITSSGGKVLNADFDQDGDQDLIVLGRQVPGNYPSSAENIFLENNKGIFTINRAWFPDAARFGMFTDALFINVIGDAEPELILTQEWGEPIAVQFINGSWLVQDIGLEGAGWWQSIDAGDIDGDGDIDLVIGNWGWNNKFHPNDSHPLHVYAGDLDGNGSNDIVLAQEKTAGLMPVRGKECSSEQMPSLLDKFSSYEAFAKANLTTIYTEEALQKALHLEVNTFTSGIFINNDGQFTFQAFPVEAQVSPIKDLHLEDVNFDGILDVVFVGNQFHSEVETVRYDAGIGGVLLGDGKGQFKFLNERSSGFYNPGDARSLLAVPYQKAQTLWLVGNNNQLVKAFTSK